jgi:hypothetical protein
MINGKRKRGSAVKLLPKVGWTLTQGKHYMLRCPCGCTIVTIGSTISDKRAHDRNRSYIFQCEQTRKLKAS